MQDGSFPMPRARRKDLALGKTLLPWSRRQLSEAGKAQMNESRTVYAVDVCWLGRRKVALLRPGRANEGARAQSQRRETKSVAKRNSSRRDTTGGGRRHSAGSGTRVVVEGSR
jgi:hypothetical protein